MIEEDKEFIFICSMKKQIIRNNNYFTNLDFFK